MPKLHVNIDHIATVRQARRETIPDPIAWALRAERAGAQGITCHLRKDRRHIQDADVKVLRRSITTRLNLEISLDPEIVALALMSRADAICIVPENRKELTTEGGLDVIAERRRLLRVIPALVERGAEVSLFVDSDPGQIAAAAKVGALFVELHTGRYARAVSAKRMIGAKRKVGAERKVGGARALAALIGAERPIGAKAKRELARLRDGAVAAHELGLRVNAGHGLNYDNVVPIAALPHVEELNIGFAIVAESLFTGVDAAVGRMAELVRGTYAARTKATSQVLR